MLPLLSQVVGPAPARAWGLADVLIAIIVVAACVMILYVALRAMGVQLPPWVIHIFVIVLVAVVSVLAIKFLLGF